MSDALNIGHAGTGLARSCIAAYLDLLRFRILALVLVATAAGFFLAPPALSGGRPMLALWYTLLGTALIAAAANALNQVIEADRDARMVRTMRRPIPSGRLDSGAALLFGLVVGLAGLYILAARVNLFAGLLGGITLGGYLLIYTPLKRFSWRSVFVGAIPGALPPVIGWTAAQGSPGLLAWLLFGIVFVWQLPHFAAIAWLHRVDYGRAGFPMLSVIDPSGSRICRHIIGYTLLLLVVSLLPAWFGLAGWTYAVGAGLLGLAFLLCGVSFTRRRSTAAARFHLCASVAYLPALLGLMMIDKVR